MTLPRAKNPSTISAADFLEHLAGRKPMGPPTMTAGKVQKRAGKSKYRNVRTEVDGVKFDSKKEAAYYSQLCLEMRAGTVRWLCLQPRFPVEGGTYVADFIVVRNTKEPSGVGYIIEVVDVKGVKTAIYRRSKKQLKARYGIDIIEV